MNPKPRRLTAHDREALPSAKKPHFFYHTTLPLDSSAIRTLGSAVRDFAPKTKLLTTEIGCYHRAELARNAPEAALQAYDKLLEQMGAGDHALCYPAVLLCRWALPHDDGSFTGKAFLSVVLHTGPEPYVMSMFTTAGRRDRTVIDTTRTLHVGDVFIFDPTLPHMAAPRVPHQDQWLVLLQIELDLKQRADYRRLLSRYPRHPEDQNSC